MGRGTSKVGRTNGSINSKKSSSGKNTKSISGINTKFSTKEISSMSRKQLEEVARAVFIKQNMARGLSESEADYRARSLMSGNTTAQLRKYVKKNG